MAAAEQSKTVTIPKSAADIQRMKLEKLMKNPAKEVHIPVPSKDHKPRGPQEFIRNVWGSSAGAGSGDFHVYRGVRRREYARQKFITEKATKEEADQSYQKKMDENKKLGDERTAKKRAKRQKKKQKQKNKKPKKEENAKSEEDESEEEEEEEEDGDEGKESSNTQKNGKFDKDSTSHTNSTTGQINGTESRS